MGTNTIDVSEQVIPEDNIFSNNAMVNETNQKAMFVVDDGISALVNGQDVANTVNVSQSKSVDEHKYEKANNYLNDNTAKVTNAIDYIAATEPDKLPVAISNVPAELEKYRQQAASMLAPYLNWIDNIEGSEKLSDYQKKSIAADALLLQSFSKGMDDYSIWGKTVDFLGVMAVPDQGYNVAELQAKMQGDEVTFRKWLSSPEAYDNIRSFRMELSPEDRVFFDQSLLRTIESVDDNKLQQTEMVGYALGTGEGAKASDIVEKVLTPLYPLDILAAASLGIKALSSLSRLSKIGNKIATIRLADTVSRYDELSKATGINKYDAASTGNPLTPEIFNGAPDGLQSMYAERMLDVEENLKRADNSFKYVSDLNEADKVEFAAAIKRNISKDMEIDNFDITFDEGKAIVKYDVVKDGVPIWKNVNQTVSYKVDDFGGFVQDTNRLPVASVRHIASPAITSGADKKLFLEAAEASVFSEARIHGSLTKAMDAAMKPVKGNKNSVSKVNEVLQRLDGKSIVPSYQELVVKGVGGIKLTDKEFAAYTGARKVLEHAWQLNNGVIRRDKELRGVKSITIRDYTYFGKPYETSSEAFRAFRADKEIRAIDHEGKLLEEITSELIEEQYAKGNVLMKADSNNPFEWFSGFNGSSKYAFVPKSEITILPRNVLGKTPNYLPKLRKDANWFIKMEKEVMVNGANRAVEHTIAYSSLEKDAIKYIDDLEKAAIEAGVEFDRSKYKVRFDKELGRGSTSEEAIRISGGLMSGSRKSTELPYVGSSEGGERVDALTSMQRYLGLTADRVALSEWRMEAKTRWYNQAKSYDQLPDIKSKSWAEAKEDVQSSGLALRNKSKLLAMHDQITSISKIPSKTEQMLSDYAVEIGKRFERSGLDNIAKYMYSRRSGGVINTIKSITYNLNLGTYSLVQIPTQLFGSAVAISIDPIYAMRAMNKWLIASGMDVAMTETEAVAYLNKVFKGTEKELSVIAKDYSFWRKSGMYESVVRGNADAYSVTNNLPYDAGVLSRGFHKFVEKGQIPFKIGEVGNMRISFFTALEKEKALAGDKFVYDNNTLQTVIARAEQYRLNMSSANKANYQKGFWSLPTQFKQIYTKYLEAIAGDWFTTSEKIRMVGVQALLWGAAGVPILNFYADTMAKGFHNIYSFITGDDIEASSEEMTMYKRGSMGWLFNSVADIDAAISGRLAVSANFIEEISKLITDQNTPVLKAAMGASFTGGDKFIDLLNNMCFAGKLVIDNTGEIDTWKIAGGIVGESLLEIPSSTRKLLLARDMYNGVMTKSDGTPLYETDPNLATIFFLGAGFGSQEAEDLYKLHFSNQVTDREISARASQYISLIYRLTKGVEDGNEKDVAETHKALTLIANSIDNIYPEDATKIWNKINKAIMKPSNFKEETIKRAIENMNSEFVENANRMSVVKQKEIELRSE